MTTLITILCLACLAPIAHSALLAWIEYRQRNAWPPRRVITTSEEIPF